jgi:hypothetical protein
VRARVSLVSRSLGGAPRGLCARGARVPALLAALRVRLEEDEGAQQAGAPPRGVIAKDGSVAVVVGDAAALPWLDGVTWLWEAAPGLWLPSTRTANVPVSLLAAALGPRLPGALIDDGVLVPLRGALPLSVSSLAARERAR